MNGIIPGSFQCLACRHVFMWKARLLLTRPPCCPRCLSLRIMPAGCVRLPERDSR